jgi:hypothetical protein
LRTLFIVWIATLSAGSAMAQQKISPRLQRSGGSAYVVVFRPGVDMAQARERLRERGFDLIEHPDLRPRDVLAAGPRARLTEIGDWGEVEHVLAASPALVARQRVMACAGPVVTEGIAAEYVEVGRGWPRPKSGPVELGFAFESLTARVEEGAARMEIERALREWEKHAKLKFGAAEAGGPRTISIRFAERAHGDDYGFDGAGGSLAHTFYPSPPNPEPVAGDMHFDAAENWQIGASMDLYSVALHEAGHALGLGHSDQPGAVMYPYYHQASGLTSDDIAGIQDLYGAREEAAPPSPPVSGPTDPPPAPPVAPPPTAPPGPQPPTTSQPPATPSDKTPPSLKIASPSRTSVTTTSASVALSGTASDDTGVVAVRWSASTGQTGDAAGTTVWSATAPVYVGTTVITVRAYDRAGNSTWRAITVTRR